MKKKSLYYLSQGKCKSKPGMHKTKHPVLERMRGGKNLHSLLVGNVQRLWKTVWVLLKSLRIELSSQSVILFGIFSNGPQTLL